MDAQRRRPSLLLMLASGVAGLGYQIVWTQQCAVWLGHESAAVLAIVAAFFGGLSAGAWALGARIERSPRPLRWYAGCEVVIALWSFLLVFAMTPFSAGVLEVIGPEPSSTWQWSVAFSATFVLLLPATAAMGATLPAMARITAGMQRDGRFIAALYACNTLGAVIGVLGATFWLVPSIGLVCTGVVCAVLNLLCGVTSLLVFPRTAEAARGVSPNDGARARGLMPRLAVTGLLGIGYEVLVVRVLSQVTQGTVYTFAMLLAVYLVGTAAGAAAYQRWLLGSAQDEALSDSLFGALSGACLLGTATLWSAEASSAAGIDVLGNGVGAALVAEAFPALLAFGPATLVMGALFSHLAHRAADLGVTFGRALAVNTLGAAAAPALFGVLIPSAVGPKLALLLVAAGYLLLTAPESWLRPLVWMPASAALLLALLAPPLAFVTVPEGGRLVSYQDGIMAAVSVVQDADGVSRLRIDNRAQEGSSGTLRVDGREAWLPLLLHPAPRRALFLGLGTGSTASSAAEDPTLEVDAVELLPEVIAASAHFTHDFPPASSRLRVIAADARRYVRASERSYAVIVSDNFHPARSGSGSLYTVEHFEAVRVRLSADGVFCQWLPLHQLDRETLRSIVQSFLSVYPQGFAILASNSLLTPVIGLVGRRDAGRFDASALRERMVRVAVRQKTENLGLEDDLAVLGSFVAGPGSLRRFAANADANTDDHPVVAHRAPRITYAPDSSPGDRLLALLRELAIEPDQLIVPGPDGTWPARLATYWAARNRFIESGRDARPSTRVEDMLAQVREPLLSVLRISPDFRPAYDPLLAMATALARTDSSGAHALLTELTQIQPARDEAARALSVMSGMGPR